VWVGSVLVTVSALLLALGADSGGGVGRGCAAPAAGEWFHIDIDSGERSRLLPLVLRAGGEKVDRWGVAGDAVDGAVQAVVQCVDVAAGQSASGGDEVVDGER